jgi:hypothetical protein
MVLGQINRKGKHGVGTINKLGNVTFGQQTEDKCMNMGHGPKRGEPPRWRTRKRRQTERQQEVVWQEQRKKMNHSSGTKKM